MQLHGILAKAKRRFKGMYVMLPAHTLSCSATTNRLYSKLGAIGLVKQVCEPGWK